MDIKGLDGMESIKPAKAKTPENRRPAAQAADRAAEPDLQEVNPIAHSKIKSYMQEIKTAQNAISEKQAFLENLNTSRAILEKESSPEKMQQELITLREKAVFNKKPLMNEILPEARDFYARMDNIKQLRNKVAREIDLAKTQIRDSQDRISKFSISIENIRASLTSNDIRQMQELINKTALHNNLDRSHIISYLT